jgi:hypothetical protein
MELKTPSPPLEVYVAGCDAMNSLDMHVNEFACLLHCRLLCDKPLGMQVIECDGIWQMGGDRAGVDMEYGSLPEPEDEGKLYVWSHQVLFGYRSFLV